MAVHVLAAMLPFLVMGDVSVARNGGIDDREHKEMIPGREQKEMVLEHQEESLHALIGQ